MGMDELPYIILVGISGLVGVWAQFKLKSTFSKYAKVPCSNGITGWQAAAQLLKINNINDVKIGPIVRRPFQLRDPSRFYSETEKGREKEVKLKYRPLGCIYRSRLPKAKNRRRRRQQS
jgi:hypothetical protein